MTAPRPMRWLLRGLAALLLVVVLVATLGSSLIAAAVLVSVMDRLDVRHAGIWTLRLNLFSARASIGPVEIGAEEGPATAERLLVDVSLPDLLGLRVVAERIEIVGLSVTGVRDESGRILLPGRPVSRILGSDAPDEAGAEEESGPGAWEFGIESVVVTDARALLTDVGGGEIDARIARFELDRLRSWEPDSPAAFRLDATLNDMAIRYAGEATPLSDTLRVSMTGGLSGVTWERIARFAGEDVEETIEGEIRTEGTHDLVVHPDGAVDGRSEGAVLLDGLLVETPEGERVTVAATRLGFALDHDVGADGRPVIAGDVSLALGPAELATGRGERITLAALDFGGRGVTVRDVSGEDRPAFAAGFLERLGAGREEGAPAPSLARLVIRLFVALAQEALARDLEVGGAASLTLDTVGGVLVDGAGAQILDATLAGGAARVEALDLAVVDGAWRISGDLSTTLDGYRSAAAVLGREIGSSVEGLRIDIPRISADSDGEAVNAALAYSIDVTGVDNETPDGGRLRVASVSVASPGVELAGRRGLQGDLSGPVDVAILGVELAAPDAGGLSVGGESARLSMERLALARGDDARGVAEGTISLAGWSARREAGGLAASLGRLDVVLPPSRVVVAEGRIAVEPEPEDQAAASPPASAADAEPPALGDVIPGPPPEPAPDAEERAAAPAGAPAPFDRPPPIPGAVDPDFVPVASVVPPDLAALPVPRPPELAPAPGAVADRLSDTPPGAFGLRLAEISVEAAAADGPVAVRGAEARLDLTSFGVESAGGVEVNVDGALALSDWRASLAGPGVEARVGRVALRADGLSVAAGAGAPRVGGAFDLVAAGLGGSAADLLGRSWDARLSELRLGIGDAAVEGRAVRAEGGLVASELAVEATEGEAEALRIEAAELSGLGLDDGGLRAEALRVDGLDATLTSALLDAAGGGGGEAPAPAGDGAAAGAPPPVEVGSIVIGPGSRVVYGDIRDSGVVRLAVDIDRFDVGPVSLAEAAPPTRFDVGLRLNEVGAVEAGGSVALPTVPDDLDATVKVSGVGLPVFSPYLEDLLDLSIASGTLDAGLAGAVAGRALDARLDLALDGFALEAVDAEAEAEFQRRFVVSTDYALDVLRGPDGRIALSLPISGTLDDPDVDLGAVIASAAGGVLVSLLPPRWIVDQWVTREGFTMAFPPGSDAVPDALRARLDRGATFLAENPDAPVQICGRATLRDVEALRDGPATAEDVTDAEVAAALDLAQRREAAIRRDLAERHGVPSDRLGQCRTMFERERSYPGVAVEVVQGDL